MADFYLITVENADAFRIRIQDKIIYFNFFIDVPWIAEVSEIIGIKFHCVVEAPMQMLLNYGHPKIIKVWDTSPILT